MSVLKLAARNGAAALLALAIPLATAQTPFPPKQVRIVVPLGPGSASDATTRVLANHLSVNLKVPVIVENKPGADSAIAVRDLINAPADGSTLIAMAATTLSINPAMSDKLTYDPKEIRPLAGLARGGALLVTSADSRFKTLKDLIAAAKEKPDSVSFGTYSASYRFGMLRFQKLAGIQLVDIPYKSPTDAVTNVVGGQVDATILEYGSGVELARGGRIRVLAVTNAQRQPALPQVPTAEEAGVPGFTFYSWLGFGVSAKTPQPIFDKLQEAVLQAAKTQEVQQHLEQRGVTSYAVTGSELAETIKAELQANRELYKQVKQ